MAVSFLGRSRELGRLRGALDRRDAITVHVHGVRGGGKTALVRRALADYPGLLHICAPLPESAQRAAVAEQISAACITAGLEGDTPAADADWPALIASAGALARQAERPYVLALDDAHRLQESRARFARALRATRASTTGLDEGPVVHIVLIGPSASISETGTPVPPTDDETESIEVGPLPLVAAAPLLPGSSPTDRLRSYAVFGGLPSVLRTLDPSVGHEANLRRLLSDPRSPLADPMAWLERDVQTPARYNAILVALAAGPADWSTVHAGVPDLTRSGQVAPYMKRLGELGLVRTFRSLDAGPRSRARRYAVADPFVAFWYRFVLPARFGPVPSGDDDRAGVDMLLKQIRTRLDVHVASVFPEMCRQHVDHEALATLGSAARTSGALWGSDYEIPVAGILSSGAAIYGTCAWKSPARASSPLTDLDSFVRRTRYGFGRERRQRLIFTGAPPPAWLRRDVARRDDATLIEPDALLG